MSSLTKDTIVALATPPGRGAISIVRLSGGEQSLRIAENLFGQISSPRQATLRTLKNKDGLAFDQAIVIYFPAPNSFTGEHMMEIQTHGGEAIVSQVLKACLDAGARLARAGEFSERAFLNGKLDLLQAEAIADLIAAGSERAARSAFNSMSGKFSAEVNDIGQSLRNCRMQMEALIDFPDEEIPTELLGNWSEQISSAKALINALIKTSRHGARLNAGVDIAIVGAPNVGKSTLLNAFAKEEKAITSDVPGTTRDIVSVDIDYKGLNIRFHDTAGLRKRPADSVEREGIRRTKAIMEHVDLCLVIRDYSDDDHEAGNDEALALMASLFADKPVIEAWNKIDLKQKTDARNATQASDERFISAKTGEGVSELLDQMVCCIGFNAEDESPYIARERHIADLQEIDRLLDFDLARIDSEPELLAERLRLAEQVIGRLLGEYTSEDLLGDIFSSFCIGK